MITLVFTVALAGGMRATIDEFVAEFVPREGEVVVIKDRRYRVMEVEASYHRSFLGWCQNTLAHITMLPVQTPSKPDSKETS